MTGRPDDVQHQLDAAYAAIRELDEDLAAGRLTAADHADLRARAERQAAALLARLRRAGEAAPAASPPAPLAPAVGRTSPWRTRAALTAGVVVLLAFGLTVGVLLGRSVSEPPGGGQAAGVRGGAAPAPSPQLEALRQQVEVENPPVRTLLAFAHLALDEGQVPAAIWAYKRVLAREPKNVEAVTHVGVILYRGGHVDQALARIDEALAIDPGYDHALWDRAHMLFEGKKDYAAAARALEAFLARVPTGEDADRARKLLAEARRSRPAGTAEGRRE